VGGVPPYPLCPPGLYPPTDGVDGVRGNDPSCEDAGSRLDALLIGRNIPAPGIEVLKYDLLKL